MAHCYKPSSYPSGQCKCQEFKNHDVDKLCLCFIYVEKSTLNNGCRASGKQMGWAARLQQLLLPAGDAPAVVAGEASAAPLAGEAVAAALVGLAAATTRSRSSRPATRWDLRGGAGI